MIMRFPLFFLDSQQEVLKPCAVKFVSSCDVSTFHYSTDAFGVYERSLTGRPIRHVLCASHSNSTNPVAVADTFQAGLSNRVQPARSASIPTPWGSSSRARA